MVIVVAPPGLVVTLVAVGVGAVLVMLVAAPAVLAAMLVAAVPVAMLLRGSTITLAVAVCVLAAGTAPAGIAAAADVTVCPVPWKNVSSSSLESNCNPSTCLGDLATEASALGSRRLIIFFFPRFVMRGIYFSAHWAGGAAALVTSCAAVAFL